MAAGSMSIGELEDALASLAAHLTAGMCRWLELVAEVDRRGCWADEGRESCAEWLAWRCSLSPRSAREHVRVARRLGALPVIHQGFRRGELSYAKVRALTRVAEPETEAELVELASAFTAAQLEQTLRTYRRVTAAEARELNEQAHLDLWWDDDGSLIVSGRLAPEDGAVVVCALDAARNALREEYQRGSAEPRRSPTRSDALVAIADASLAVEVGQRTGGDRYQVVVHVDADTLAGGGEQVAVLEDGPALAAETARRLACDSSIVTIHERDGTAVDVGRKTRSIPPALRRALNARDRTCRYPGCENTRFLDAHHVQHWARGGETSLDNLVLLCARHHRLLHEGGFSVDHTLCFYDRRGAPIPDVHAPPPGEVDGLLEQTHHLEITPHTLRPGMGDRLDLDLAVAGIIQIARSSGAAIDPG